MTTTLLWLISWTLWLLPNSYWCDDNTIHISEYTQYRDDDIYVLRDGDLEYLCTDDKILFWQL